MIKLGQLNQSISVMAGSLQDQLLSKGLINKNKAKKIQREQQHQKRVSKKHKTELVDEAKVAAQEAIKAKSEKDKQLNQQQKAKAEEVAIAAQIKQLIETNSVAIDSKDVAYLFNCQGKSQTLVVSKLQEQHLNKGRLVIVQLINNKSSNDFYLVPNQVADKIAARNDNYIAYQADLQQLNSDEEDPYADYQIPDDLMW